jgi:hypothetical protein
MIGCQGGACVTAKIDEYANRLKTGNYDRWGASGDLAGQRKGLDLWRSVALRGRRQIVLMRDV